MSKILDKEVIWRKPVKRPHRQVVCTEVMDSKLLVKVSKGEERLLRIGGKKAESGKLVNSGVLEQPQFRACDTEARNYFHIHLDSLTRIGHLLVGLGDISFFLLFLREHIQLAHDAEQALRALARLTPYFSAYFMRDCL